MRAELNDLRILKLAEMYEMAYERFVLEVAMRVVDDEDLRSRLLQLASPGDAHHERIVHEIERLNARFTPEDKEGIVRAALLDVRDVERAAREFYLTYAERVHDRTVAKLFAELAREEARHTRIAEEVLRKVEERSGAFLHEELPEGVRLMREGETLPLREGTSDFGESRLHHGPVTKRTSAHWGPERA